MSVFGIKSLLCKAIVIEDFVYTTSKEEFLITYQKIFHVNLEYIDMLKPWKTCELTTMKHQLKTV